MNKVLRDIQQHAENNADHPAIVSEGEGTISYGELWERVQERADQFGEAGVGRASRCAFFCEEGDEFIVSGLAILSLGACIMPVPLEHRDDPDSRYITELQPHFVVDCVGAVETEKRSDVRPVDGSDDELFRDVDPAYIRFTSGTTSEQKGVLLGHESIHERTNAANRALEIGPEDNILWVLPMVHHFVVSILLYLRNGATILLPDSDLAGPQLEFARAEGCTVMYATPFQHNLMAKGDETIELPELRLAISTASGLREEIARRFHERFSLPLTQALGIIEAGLPVINLARAEEKPLSLGQPLPDYDVTVIDGDGRPLERGEVGEIAVNGPGLLDAYIRPWKSRLDILDEHGFHTGDQGRFDEDGDLFLVGRRANRINMAGMKFFCEEVERVLNSYEGVDVSRVKSRDHDHLGEIPVADVVLEETQKPPSEAELQAFCRDRLETHKVPRMFKFVGEIPRTSTGKIERSS